MLFNTMKNPYDPVATGSQNVIVIIVGSFIILFITIAAAVGITLFGNTWNPDKRDYKDKAIPICGFITVVI